MESYIWVRGNQSTAGANPAATRHRDVDGIWRRQFFSVSISSKDVVVQKIQEIEISSAFQTACIFGDPRPYRRRASRIWRNAGLERLPPRWVPFD